MITSNRINMPEVAEAVLARGDADLVSMARPMLADPELVNKAAQGREDEINTCIACNQACLDHTFGGRQQVSCLVNPRACNETRAALPAGGQGQAHRGGRRRAGRPGRGHGGGAARPPVTLFDAGSEIGGQFNLAKRIPGKEEFHETLRYYRTHDRQAGHHAAAEHRATPQLLRAEGFDEVVVATGIEPRRPAIPASTIPRWCPTSTPSWAERPSGKRVAIMGAGGIGFDVAELITHAGTLGALDIDVFAREWGIDFKNHPRGGVTGVQPQVARSEREVMADAAQDRRAGQDAGPHHRLDAPHDAQPARRADGGRRRVPAHRRRRPAHPVNGEPRLFEVDTVIVCAGQTPLRTLYDELQALA
jgi:2,4-dienoyl-CoA reductase (NADPH2)